MSIAKPMIDGGGRAVEMQQKEALRSIDLGWMGLLCILLFGYSMVSGRPLSLHEARLPELSREMMRSGDWLIPRSGGRPWLERPPLPHWVTIAVSAMLGQQSDQVWVVRLPAALAGMLVVLLSAWVAARWFGRWVGICSGLILATSYEFYAYSSLAEDDIFLAALVMIAMALLVKLEFPASEAEGETSTVWGRRSWTMLAFFVMVGLTNLAKGPLLGMAVVLAVVGAYLLSNGDWRSIQRFIWVWGWLALAAIAVWWPWVVFRRYPNVLDNWQFDYADTTQYNQPVWYYPVQLLGALAPWTPVALWGLWLSGREARKKKSPQRFLWCWAIVPVVVLSVPARKHHHYLVPSLAPWAILAALGFQAVLRSMFSGPAWSRKPGFGLAVVGLPGATALLLLRNKIPGPMWATLLLATAWVGCVVVFYWGLCKTRAGLVLGALVAGIIVACCWGQSCLPDQTTSDTIFLKRVEAMVPRDRLLLINGDLKGELDFFRIGFYLRQEARLIHNLSFLRDDKITDDEVYLITRAKDQDSVNEFGHTELLLQSARTRREKSPEDRFTLYRLRFRPDLKRYPAPAADDILPMQAMGRKDGPYCGPAIK